MITLLQPLQHGRLVELQDEEEQDSMFFYHTNQVDTRKNASGAVMLTKISH